MSICLKCGKEITYLTFFRPKIDMYSISVCKTGVEFDIEEQDIDGLYRENYIYYCPICGVELFDNEEDVIKFLKGEC